MKKQFRLFTYLLLFVLSVTNLPVYARNKKSLYKSISVHSNGNKDKIMFKLRRYKKQAKIKRSPSGLTVYITVKNTKGASVTGTAKKKAFRKAAKKLKSVNSIKGEKLSAQTIRFIINLSGKHPQKLIQKKNSIILTITKKTANNSTTHPAPATADPATNSPDVSPTGETDTSPLPPTEAPNYKKNIVLEKDSNENNTYSISFPYSKKSTVSFSREAKQDNLNPVKITINSLSGKAKGITNNLPDSILNSVTPVNLTKTKSVLRIKSVNPLMLGAKIADNRLIVRFTENFISNTVFTSTTKKGVLKCKSITSDFKYSISPDRMSLTISLPAAAETPPLNTIQMNDNIISNITAENEKTAVLINITLVESMFFLIQELPNSDTIKIIMYNRSGLAKKVVCLDAGHGGNDNGAVGKINGNTYKESYYTLDLVERINMELQDRGIPTLLTRKDDVKISLDNRVKIANSAGAALFLSIHYNSYTSSSANGSETYYYNRSSTGTIESKDFAKAINSAIVNTLNTVNRGVKTAGFVVIKKTTMPAVLAEIGFITNAGDVNKFTDEDKKNKLAVNIANAIIDTLFG